MKEQQLTIKSLILQYTMHHHEIWLAFKDELTKRLQETCRLGPQQLVLVRWYKVKA